MPAAEVQLLVDDLRAELTADPASAEAGTRAVHFDALLGSFVQDWRQLCALHGIDGRGREAFLRLAGAVQVAARSHGDGVIMRTNGASASLVLEKRVLEALVPEAGQGLSE